MNSHDLRLKQTSKTQKNSNFLSGWRGPLVMIFGGVGVGHGGQMRQEQWGKEGQMADKGGDGRIQEGQMAISMGDGTGGEMTGTQMG